MQYYEDMPLGLSSESTETFTFSAEDIKEFAGKWDPMPFHIDEELAAQTPIGKLFATSIHTIAASIRLTHTTLDKEVAAVAGLGWNDIKFPQPVCAGDTIRIKSEVVDRRESNSKPDCGIITSKTTVFNQRDEVVAEYKISTLVMKRPG